MARSILIVAAIAWLVAGVAALAVALFGSAWVTSLLPPLTIDADAVRGATTALAFGLLAIGAAHLAVLASMRAGHRLAHSAGILLAAFLAAALFALAVASATSAMVTPASAPIFVAVAVGCAVASAGYGLVAVRLIGERRSESAF